MSTLVVRWKLGMLSYACAPLLRPSGSAPLASMSVFSFSRSSSTPEAPPPSSSAKRCSRASPGNCT